MSSWAASRATESCASTVEAPRCGVSDDVGQLQQRMVGRRRLLHEDVEGGAGEMARSERLGQRLLVDDAAAGAVDDARALAASGRVPRRRSGCVVSSVSGVWTVRKSQRGSSGSRSATASMPSWAAPVRGEERIEAEDLHVEAGGAAGDLAADAAQADDAERLAGELGADELAALPLAGAHAGVGGGDVPGQGHQQGDGVLGGADGVAAGRVHDDDALARGGGHVDVIHADAGADDGPQLAGIFQQLGRDLGAAADDHAVGRPQGSLAGAALEAGPVVHLEAGLSQQVEAGGFEFVADEDAGMMVDLTS